MMSLRALVARRYCDAHQGTHVCHMGRDAGNVAAAAVVEWLETPEVNALVGDDAARLLVKTIQEEP